NGGPVAKESILDSMFERVIVTTNRACTANDPQGTGGGIPVKAGDLMGHLGRYDSLNECSGGTRMAHIEVFCGEDIKPFIKAGRAWVDTHVEETPTITNQWNDLGVSQDPTILRVGRGTTLYQTHANGQPGTDPKQTDVIQVYQFAALPQDDVHMFMEKNNGNDGHTRRWWKMAGADALRNPISGWVREQSFEGGRVTRESAQSWTDFECYDEDHDPTHTIFATTADYVDYALGGDTPGAGSLGKLSPLMAAIYRALYPTGDGSHAADDLCSLGQSAQGGFPWAAFRASRLIPKHESEWANPAKWQALVDAIEERTGPKPEHEEEKKRIANLVWWDEVAAGIPGFPGSDVYHINPIGLVGNFIAVSTVNAEDLDYLARTLYGEARGESYQSKLAVAWIIRNRVQRGHKTYKQIVTAPYQFTCWSATIDPVNYHAIHNPTGPAWADAQRAAEEVLSAPDTANIIPGATNYYSPGAQAALHATNPAQYPAVPPFAAPEKRVQNPEGVSEHAYRFYRP
uniref:cell wall hydrolase n=1 Tax=Paraburkholderia ferrariae TaxID=386056 RepID=UPI001C3F473A